MHYAACKVEFNHSIGRTHSWRFSFFYKINKPLESAPRGSPIDPKFWWCNNGDILVWHKRCESPSPRRRNEPLGYYFTRILDRMIGFIGAYYRGEADFSFCCQCICFVVICYVFAIFCFYFIFIFYCLHRNMSESIYVACGRYSQRRFHAQVISG